jgi:hypothetical protein
MKELIYMITSTADRHIAAEHSHTAAARAGCLFDFIKLNIIINSLL